ncbi:MAG: hypothetical protein PHG27_08040, partial [Massilibacteroides sp.]|nr:hypothetical protein [Massilibacteroides sp.]MDD3062528.1 hypothetical protein [Massilibacteroides sp.]MDD4115527.1 hypothetical protein [Massilibacteroides sp.]MDD4660326.1 hypothetical protein [Massilibacteroides sp.]
MKSKLITLYMILSFATLNSYGQKQIDTAYDFPIKPGSEKWASFNTHEEMVEACQIPEDILNQLSTPALVETCINYPLRYDYIAYNDVRKGISIILNSFNGFLELSKRTDATTELIKAYNNIPIIKEASKIIEENEPLIRVGFVELLISNELFFQKMTTDDYANLQKITKKKYLEKAESPELYSLFNIQKTMLLGANILVKTKINQRSNSDTNDLNTFIQKFE